VPEGRPVGFHPRTHQGPLWGTTSGLLPPRWKTSGLALPDLGKVEFVEKPGPEHLEPLETDPAFHDEEIYEVDRHHPIQLRDLGVLPTWFLDGLDLSEARPDPSDKPEVVVRRGFPCAGGVFSTGVTARGSPSRFPPSEPARTALPVRCRHGGKRRDWPSRTWVRSDSSKNPVPNTCNRSKRTPLSMIRRSTTRRKRG